MSHVTCLENVVSTSLFCRQVMLRRSPPEGGQNGGIILNETLSVVRNPFFFVIKTSLDVISLL